MSESKSQAKPFEISKRVVWEAYLRVKANKGAAGVDGQVVLHSEVKAELAAWVQRGSGSWTPKPVRRVWIPKRGSGKQRPLGIPTEAA